MSLIKKEESQGDGSNFAKESFPPPRLEVTATQKERIERDIAKLTPGNFLELAGTKSYIEMDENGGLHLFGLDSKVTLVRGNSEIELVQGSELILGDKLNITQTVGSDPDILELTIPELFVMRHLKDSDPLPANDPTYKSSMRDQDLFEVLNVPGMAEIIKRFMESINGRGKPKEQTEPREVSVSEIPVGHEVVFGREAFGDFGSLSTVSRRHFVLRSVAAGKLEIKDTSSYGTEISLGEGNWERLQKNVWLPFELGTLLRVGGEDGESVYVVSSEPGSKLANSKKNSPI